MKEPGPNEWDADDTGAQEVGKSGGLNGKPGAVSNSYFSFSHSFLYFFWKNKALVFLVSGQQNQCDVIQNVSFIFLLSSLYELRR